MKISPINNYQISKNQKIQTKSNPNFEGVKLVVRKPNPELLGQEFNSPQEVEKFKIELDKALNELNTNINKKFLPREVKAMLKDRSEKTYEDAIERIWPNDTEYELHCIDDPICKADILINNNRGSDIKLKWHYNIGVGVKCWIGRLNQLNDYLNNLGPYWYHEKEGHFTEFLVQELKRQPNFESYMQEAKTEMRILERTEALRQKIHEIEMDYSWSGDNKKGRKEALEAYTNTLINKINNNEISIADAKDELTILSKEQENNSANVTSRLGEVIKNKEAEVKVSNLIDKINNNKISIVDAKNELAILSKEQENSSANFASRIEEVIKNKEAEIKRKEAEVKQNEAVNNVSNLIKKIYDGVPFSDIEKNLTKLSKKYNDDVLDVDTIFEENFKLKLNKHKKYFNITTGAQFDSSYTKLMENLKEIYSKEKFENLEKDIKDLAPLLDDKYIIAGDLKTNNILLKYPNARKQVIMRCIKDTDSNNISHSIESDGNIYNFAVSKNSMINSFLINRIKSFLNF